MKIQKTYYIMKLISFIFSLCFLAPCFSQIGTGQWRLHVSPTSTIDVAAGNGVVFAAYPAGMEEYDIASGESSFWTDVNSLSDINLTALLFDPVSDAFWVGYTNGNIDKIKNNKVTNIPAIQLAPIQGKKKVNKFIQYGGFIYVSSDMGIVKINPKRNEVVDTYYPSAVNEPILEITFRQDTIFALTAKKIFKAHVNNSALADAAQWRVDTRVFDPGNDASYKSLVTYNNDLFIVYAKDVYAQDSVYKITNQGLEVIVGNASDLEIKTLKVINNALYVTLEDGILIYNTSLTNPVSFYKYEFANSIHTTAVAYYDGMHYIGDRDYGLIQFTSNETNKQLKVNGPPKNSYYSISGNEGKMIVTGGTLLQSGFIYNNSGGYTMENEEWKLFDIWNQSQWLGKSIWDISSASVNPKDPKEIAFGSNSEYSVHVSKDGNQITNSYNINNSALEASSLGNNTICVSDVQYDEKGNLWIINCFSNNPLKVLTPEGLWYSYDVGTPAKSKFTGKVEIDYNGNKWFYVPSVGLYGYNDGGTIADASDDKYKLLNNGTNTGNLPSNNVTALAVDFDNKIWIGTDNGFTVLYNSAGIFDALPGAYNAQRIKLEYEGNVEYMLGYTHITDIEVDGANRKWMATAGAGIFCLSPDGLEIIQELNTDNSKLISNNIMDMHFNHKTGELFIITDKGMVSYRTDASYEDPEYSNVIVFPNPVHPGFSGMITMQGIKYNSDIKVTDMAGNLVYKTVSNGGTATWNGNNLKGERVKSGVYLIWTASNDGKGRKVGKVTVIN